MEPSGEIVAAINGERLARARRMSGEGKLLAGSQSFAIALECMRFGIQAQNPSADESSVTRLVKERVAQMRRKDEALLAGSPPV